MCKSVVKKITHLGFIFEFCCRNKAKRILRLLTEKIRTNSIGYETEYDSDSSYPYSDSDSDSESEVKGIQFLNMAYIVLKKVSTYGE